MKEIFSVNSQHANGKRKYSCKEKFDELGRVKGGGNRGGSGAWQITVRRLAHKIEPRSTGVDCLGLKVSHHLCITEVTYVCQYIFTGFQRAQDHF